MRLENKANELAAKVSSLICDLDIKADKFGVHSDKNIRRGKRRASCESGKS